MCSKQEAESKPFEARRVPKKKQKKGWPFKKGGKVVLNQKNGGGMIIKVFARKKRSIEGGGEVRRGGAYPRGVGPSIKELKQRRTSNVRTIYHKVAFDLKRKKGVCPYKKGGVLTLAKN